MEKQIFNQYDETMEETFQPKQEFDNVETIEDEPLEGELLDEQFEQAMKPQSKGWKTLLKLTALLFGVATVAQSVQWIWDSFQNRQWIYFAFSLVSLVVVLFGVKEIVGEWQRLVYLKKRENLQQQSRLFWQKSAVKNADVFAADGEQGKKLCLEMAKSLKLDDQSPAIVQWQSQLNEAYSAQEVAQLFSQNVLKPLI